MIGWSDSGLFSIDTTARRVARLRGRSHGRSEQNRHVTVAVDLAQPDLTEGLQPVGLRVILCHSIS
jgi:hypothetical protein